jgi:chromosome segregation ATPase
MPEESLENRIKELQNRCRELENELAERDNEIIDYLYKLEQNDARIAQLEQLVPEESDKKKGKKKNIAESKLILKLEEKDQEIRDIKNRLGYLRKEKVQLQQEKDEEIRDLKNRLSSSVIRVEDLREQTPLNALVKELQDKVNKQKSEINRLRVKTREGDEFDDKLKDYELVIETYKSEINELNQKISELSIPSDKDAGESIAKDLIEDLQKQLNKSKLEILELRQKLSKKAKKADRKGESREIKKLEDQIKDFKQLLNTKNKEIESLKASVINGISSVESGTGSSGMIKTLKEDLQNKLNKAKLEIRSLQDQLSKYKSGDVSGSGESQKVLEGKVKMQREMAIFLEDQLKTKEEEIDTKKNEAVQIKKRYRQLETQLKLKDQKLEEMQKQIDSQNIRPSAPPKEDPQLSLRLRELKGIVQDLEKNNIEQRLEIAQLRKK